MEKEIYYEIDVYKIIENKVPLGIKLNYGTTSSKEQILHLKCLKDPNLVQIVRAVYTNSEDSNE